MRYVIVEDLKCEKMSILDIYWEKIVRSCVFGNCEIDYFKLIFFKRINRIDG